MKSICPRTIILCIHNITTHFTFLSKLGSFKFLRCCALNAFFSIHLFCSFVCFLLLSFFSLRFSFFNINNKRWRVPYIKTVKLLATCIIISLRHIQRAHLLLFLYRFKFHSVVGAAVLVVFVVVVAAINVNFHVCDGLTNEPRRRQVLFSKKRGRQQIF